MSKLPINVVFVVEGEEEHDSEGFVNAVVQTQHHSFSFSFILCCWKLLWAVFADPFFLHLNVVCGCRGEQKNNEEWFKGTDVLLVSNGYWVGNKKPCLTYGMRGVVQVSTLSPLLLERKEKKRKEKKRKEKKRKEKKRERAEQSREEEKSRNSLVK